MKITATILALYIGVISAAPAIVWRGDSPSGPAHISEAIDAHSLLSTSLLHDERDAALAGVVFLVGRNADGSEGLPTMTAAGRLPGVQEKYGHASAVHHHVQGVESARTVARDARSAGGVATVTLEEFQRKLDSLGQAEAAAEEAATPAKLSKADQKRRRAVADADVLVVTAAADGNAAGLDAAVVAAIDSPAVRNVVLASVRSVQEVKHARKLAVLGKFGGARRAAAAGGRRLEDEAANENNNNNNNQDNEGTYYVNMTPNIFAGLLFFFLFAFTAHLGLMCMNMIEGQDVFLVTKYPPIGREA